MYSTRGSWVEGKEQAESKEGQARSWWFYKKFFFNLLALHIYVFIVYVLGWACVETRGQTGGVWSLLPLCASQGVQACQQAPIHQASSSAHEKIFLNKVQTTTDIHKIKEINP